MARRELLCAARKAEGWEAALGGGKIDRDLHSGQQDLGSPGGPGGRETQHVGVYTEHAGLAYDMARMAFRRTTSFYERMPALNGSTWDEPAPNDPLAATDAPSGGRGTFCGAVLQNIAPYCETPELALLKSQVESNIGSIPADFNALVDLVTGWINGIGTAGLQTELASATNRLKNQLVTALNGLKDADPGRESVRERLYNELKREVSAACFGRRDTQWALAAAIRQARHFIYVETPGFSFTEGDVHQSYTLNLVTALQEQLAAKPGLRVIICVPRQPDYQPQYEQWTRSEVKERYALIQGLPANQVVSFHPVGFPGRPSNLEQQVVIVDDWWALVGSSAFRRRGLTFDGSTDVVFTDGQTRNGAASSIRNLRKSLLMQRLGIHPAQPMPAAAVMVEEGGEAFHLVRQMLVAGGLGKIERLWNGRTEGVAFTEPSIDRNVANPEGLEFDALTAGLFSAFAALAK